MRRADRAEAALVRLRAQVEQAHDTFCERIDKELEHYAGKIAKRAFRAALTGSSTGDAGRPDGD